MESDDTKVIDECTRKLRERYSPNGSLLRRDQLHLLNLLKVFSDICNNNNIKWWLSSGTLLGCIRHNGFIPWDDDIDVVMYKEDYKRFVSIMKTYQSDKYVFQTIDSDFNYISVFGKFRERKGSVTSKNPHARFYKWKGVGLDVFALERSSYMTAFLSSKTYAFLMRFAICENAKYRKLITRLLQFMCFNLFFPLFRVFNFLAHEGELHYIQGSGWAGHFFNKKDIDPLSTHLFEGQLFPVPKNYDSYLRNVYGDYLQIPSEQVIKQNIHCKEYIVEIYKDQS